MRHRIFSFLRLPILFLTTAALAAPVAPKEISFSDHGKPVKTISLAEWDKAFPSTPIKVWEWHEQAEATYRATAANDVLTAVYGDRWKSAEDILFICHDGYRQPVGAEKFLRRRALFAVDRVDGPHGFSLLNHFQNNERVALGPLYLIWDNLKDEAFRAAGISDVPYQIVGVDLVDFKSHNPRSAPPVTASAKAKRGFVAFRENCMTCHAVNGDGGKKSIELNSPTSVTERLPETRLRQWLLDPNSLKPGTKMVSLKKTRGENAEALADEVIAYLREMVKHKKF